MYVTRVPNRSSPPAVLLRESFREDGKVKTRTLANLTHWPDAKVEALRRVLRGETVIAAAEHVEIERSLPHGHVAAVLGTLRAIGLDRLLPRRPERLARSALALVDVARVVELEDRDRPAATAFPGLRRSPPPEDLARRPGAEARARKTDDGEPVHSFRTLLADLATLTHNTMRLGEALPFTALSRPTAIQQRAFDLLGIALAP